MHGQVVAVETLFPSTKLAELSQSGNVQFVVFPFSFTFPLASPRTHETERNDGTKTTDKLGHVS